MAPMLYVSPIKHFKVCVKYWFLAISAMIYMGVITLGNTLNFIDGSITIGSVTNQNGS